MKLKYLRPHICFNKLSDITLNTLKDNNITHIWLDIDNTVAKWGSEYVSDDVLTWVTMVKNAGISLYLVTNGNKQRVDVIAKKLGIGFYKAACKPNKKRLSIIAAQMNCDNNNIAVIGDQLFTDVLSANRIGAYAILLKPISRHEWWATKVFNRSRERIVWKKIFKNENYNDYMKSIERY